MGEELSDAAGEAGASPAAPKPSSAAIHGAAPRRGRRRRPRTVWPYMFAFPTIALLGLVFVYPVTMVVRDSLYAGSANDLTYVGTANYKSVVQDPVFVTSVVNNLKLLLTVPLMTVLALAIALLLHDRVRAWRQYRAIVFLPYILPATAMGLAFSFLLERNGVANTFLRGLGLSPFALDWLGSAKVVMASIGGVVIWHELGFGVVVFTAALLTVPQETIEAGLLDGLSWRQLQQYVVIPQIRRIIEFFMVLEAVTVLSWVFNYVYVLTSGGPANSSSVMEYYIWKNGFALGSVGIAATVAVMLLGMAGVLIFVFFRLQMKRVTAHA